MQTIKKRLYKLEMVVMLDDAELEDRAYQILLRTFDKDNSVLQQIDHSLSVDVVHRLINDISFLRDLHSRDVESLSDDELEYMYQAIKSDKQNLLDDEMVFMQKYEEIFNKKFFPDGATASRNYLMMIKQNVPMALNISLSEFVLR